MNHRLRFRCGAAALVMLCCACRTQVREYPLRGQVVAIASDRTEITVNHDDIPDFMSAMTMAYHVRDPAAVPQLVAGDLITANLIVPQGAPPYLTNIKRTGHAAAPAAGAAPHVMDVLQPGDIVPGDALQDQNGVTRRLSDWRNRAIAVTFIYTRCPLPDFCPLIDRKFVAVQRSIVADSTLKDAVHLVTLSFDPAYDTPAVLKAHAQALGADPRIWSFVTAPPPVMTRVAQRFGVSPLGTDAAISTITHNLRTAVIDPKGRVVTIYSGADWLPDTLIHDLRNALGR